MIAGPILPRTAEGLWRVVQDDPSRVEHGLELLRFDLELEDGVHIDALAADAAGRPVLMFCAMVEVDHALPARIADARAWFTRSVALVRSLLDGARVRLDLPPRVVVVGFEFTERCLARLRTFADVDLVVVRVDAVRVGGRTHVGTVVVHHSGASDDTTLAALACGDTASRVLRLGDLLSRLDPAFAIDGDRFARTWRCDGVPIVLVMRAARQVVAVVPGHTPVALEHDDAVDDVVDLASRRYLGIVAGWDDTPAVAPHGFEIRDREARDIPPAARRAAEAEVTAAEYDAFFADEAPESPS
ncbi:MAG: hypothetical protein HZB39_12650 [Planctomycetes bacterium]|nr:hypothetical protein [Planctomycetota bacterium]